MIKFTFLLLCVFFSNLSSAQKIETVYLSPGDTVSNLYIIVYPPKLPWKGYAFFVPGMFQKAKDVLTQTDLPEYAARQGILTIIPTFKTGISSFGIDSATQESFLELLEHVRSNNKLETNLKFYLGGFSIGGTCALKYAELALANNYPVKPAAVFAIDSPLDFERAYSAMLREVRLPNSSADGLAESNYILKRSRKEFGGTPSDNLENYYRISPYSYNDTTQQAIKSLVNLPIRLYTEPDVMWWLTEGVDYSQMNAFDFAAMTNELKRLGNNKVELILTNNRGYRKPGNTRHPHSWSIAEPKDLVKWMLAR